MRFDTEERHIITKKCYMDIRREPTNVSKEMGVYCNDNFKFFGITKNFGIRQPLPGHKWGLVHLPSESFIMTIFSRKRDVEDFFDYLSKQADLNSLMLCTPEYHQVIRELHEDMEVAYRNYYSEVKKK